MQALHTAEPTTAQQHTPPTVNAQPETTDAPRGGCPQGPLGPPEVLNGKRELPHTEKHTHSTEHTERSQEVGDTAPGAEGRTPTPRVATEHPHSL